VTSVAMSTTVLLDYDRAVAAGVGAEKRMLST
jgi:hypothetical protein